KIEIQDVRLVLPPNTILEREARRDLPGVLRVQTKALVAARVVQMERRLRAVSDPQKKSYHRQSLEIVNGVDLEREIQQRERRGRHTHTEKEFRREKICSRWIEESPVAGAVKVLPLSAKLNSMASALKAHVVGQWKASKIASLRRIEVVAQRKI